MNRTSSMQSIRQSVPLLSTNPSDQKRGRVAKTHSTCALLSPSPSVSQLRQVKEALLAQLPNISLQDPPFGSRQASSYPDDLYSSMIHSHSSLLQMTPNSRRRMHHEVQTSDPTSPTTPPSILSYRLVALDPVRAPEGPGTLKVKVNLEDVKTTNRPRSTLRAFAVGLKKKCYAVGRAIKAFFSALWSAIKGMFRRT